MQRAEIARRDEQSFKVAAGPTALIHVATPQQTLHICCNDKATRVIALGADGQRAAGLTRLPDSTLSHLKKRFSCGGARPRVVRVPSFGATAAVWTAISGQRRVQEAE